MMGEERRARVLLKAAAPPGGQSNSMQQVCGKMAGMGTVRAV